MTKFPGPTGTSMLRYEGQSELKIIDGKSITRNSNYNVSFMIHRLKCPRSLSWDRFTLIAYNASFCDS